MPKSYATVVKSPYLEITGSVPMLQRRKQPVPYVFFALPGEKAHWPTRAEDWSPRQPVIGAPFSIPDVRDPNSVGSDDGTIFGSRIFSFSRPKNSRSRSSYVSVWMLRNMVLEAFVGSVTWMFRSTPPFSLNSNQESTVPNASRCASYALRTAGTFSRSQRSLTEEG